MTKEQLKLENYKLKLQIEHLKNQVSKQSPTKDLETPGTTKNSECLNTSLISEEH